MSASSWQKITTNLPINFTGLCHCSGTFLVHANGTAIAIVCSWLSFCEKKKNVKQHSKKRIYANVEGADSTIKNELDRIKLSQHMMQKQKDMMVSMMRTIQNKLNAD